MTKFRSAPTGLHQEVLASHERAEVRITGIRRAIGSHYLRVFLNAPEADDKTPIRDNDNYVGYIGRFGHGNCVGGPGHCDVPSQTQHKFDHRPRHHNTPTNHRLDATETVKKLVAKGATDFEVNVVVVGGHGQLATGDSRAFFDSVSLHFCE